MLNWHELNHLLRTQYAGNSLRKWLLMAGLVLLGLIAAIFVRFFLTRIVPKFTARTETTLDDRLVASAKGPFSILTFFAFVHVALQIPRLPTRLHTFVVDTNAVALAVVIAVLLWRILDVLFDELMEPWADRHVPPINRQVVSLTRTSVKLLVVALIAVTGLQRAGFDVLSVVTGLGIGGVAVALAAQETLANILGALQIMTDQPFVIGDVIRVDNEFSGRVVRMGLRSTRMVTTSGVTIIVPNKKIAAAVLQNHSHPSGLIRDILLQVDYLHDMAKLRQAQTIVEEVLKSDPRIAPNFNVHLASFGDWGSNLRVIYYIPDLDAATATSHEVLLKIREQFDAAGIGLAVPRLVHVAEAGKKAP